MIIVRTPLRLSFVGGGSDLKAFYEKKDGMVISSAIDKFVYVIVKGSLKNNLVEFALKFAVDLIDLIEQNRRNSELFRGQFY